MKRYSVFRLFVIKKGDYYFICENIGEYLYREIFTNEKFKVLNNENIEALRNYYSFLAIMNYATREPLMLTKKELLIKYAEINSPYIEKIRQHNMCYEKLIEEQDKYIEALKELSEKNPEKAKKLAIESLKRTGILDESGDITTSYNTLICEDITICKENKNIRTLKNKKKIY